MLGDVIGWALALIVVGRFSADHLIFPVIATVKHMFFEEDEKSVETHAIGFDLSPRGHDDEEDD